MGVLQCDRFECKNILCDRLSPTHGYICSECFDELISLGSETNLFEFMDSPKGCLEPIVDPYEKFNEEFRLYSGD